MIQLNQQSQLEFLNNRNFRMFLVRDFSKQNLKKQQSIYHTLRSCTSEKRLLVFPPQNQYIRVGSYKYKQQDLLGKGFSSKVYKASHINNSQDRFAIKVINLKKFKASNISMLESEIEVHRSLSHPNIVQFYDSYKTENYYYIITEYCPHGDLMEMLNQKKKLEQFKAQNIIQQIIQGYSYLTKRSVFHRDLKPANILRNGQTWKIADFGFSIICKSQCFFDKINVGTPLYMPLQSLKSNKYSFKSDIFAIGIILFQMLTGRTPWQCKTQKQLISKMKTQRIKIPDLKNINLKKLIQKACEIDENSRYSVNELQNYFNPDLSHTNPQQKQNDRKSLKNMLSMKNLLKQAPKIPMVEISKNKTLSKDVSSAPSTAACTSVNEPSTQVSQKSDSHRIKQKQNYAQKNNKIILQQLQYCRLIYYMTKNMKYFPLKDQKIKSFLTLTLFKHLLKCVKQLQEPNQTFSQQLINYQNYQNNKEFKKLLQQIKSYSKRYEKEYLDVLKNTEISVIRAVNKKFPQLSYNSALGENFYKIYFQYFSQILRVLNHQIISCQVENDRSLVVATYQALDSLFNYCLCLQQKLKASESKKYQVFINFNQKVVMDYRNTKLQKKDFQGLRQRIRRF